MILLRDYSSYISPGEVASYNIACMVSPDDVAKAVVATAAGVAGHGSPPAKKHRSLDTRSQTETTDGEDEPPSPAQSGQSNDRPVMVVGKERAVQFSTNCLKNPCISYAIA